MVYTVFRTTTFKKSFKKLQEKEKEQVFEIIEKLINGETLEKKYRNHLLTGNFQGCIECHIKPDLLLIYKIIENEIELVLVEVGTHSQLFK